jgi:YidC/Oxa1 family membrane protein insertase
MAEYQSPDQQPGNERRLLLIFAATFIIILLAQPLMKRFMPPPSVEPKQNQTTEQTNPATAPTSTPATAAPATTPPTGSKQAAAETETVVENDLYRIVFTNRGAQVKSWVLKKYSDDHGRPQELVNETASKQYGYPMSLFTYDAGLRQKLSNALYVPNASGHQSAPKDLTFEYADGDVTVTKSFHFDHSYVVHVNTKVTVGGQAVVALPSWPAGFGDQTVPASYASSRIDYQPGDKVTRLSPDRKGQKISGGATIRTPFYWGGTVGQYFAAIFLPDDPNAATLVMKRNPLEIPQNLNRPDPNKTTKVEVLGAAVGNASAPTSERVFVGPKALDVIERIEATPMSGSTAPNLGSLVDFGFFGIIAKPLFLWLKWTQQHMIPNWGWAIAFLTLVINVALLPLRISSMKSSLKMQKAQPVIKNMQDRYKAKMSKLDSRDVGRKRELQAEMNQEMMKIYKEEGINPAGGCLPLLIQMPFLWAFYTMLGVTIELRQAPWLWVSDLASPDPYHILPILIVVSTFLMQKSTPNPGMDPAQQRMMNWMMPLMLGFFAWNYAAGLSVYWLLGTVIAIIQQHITNRTKFGREMREVMEKRARKHAGDKK